MVNWFKMAQFSALSMGDQFFFTLGNCQLALKKVDKFLRGGRIKTLNTRTKQKVPQVQRGDFDENLGREGALFRTFYS